MFYSPIVIDDNPNTGRLKINTNFQANDDEFATCIKIDGSVSMDSTVNMGSYRIVNLGAGVNPDDAINKGQLDDEVNKFAPKNWVFVSPGYVNTPPEGSGPGNSRAGVGGKANSFSQAISYASADSTNGNNWYVKIYGQTTEYSADFQNFINFIHLEGDGNPILNVPQDINVGTKKAKITTNSIIENIRFKFDGLVQVILDCENTTGEFKNCTFFFTNAYPNPDLLCRGVKITNCDLVPTPSGTITLDGTTNNYINHCRFSVDLTNPGNNEVNTNNQTIANLRNYINY